VLVKGGRPWDLTLGRGISNAWIALDIGEEEKDGGESSGSDANLDDYDMEEY
jgi:hypothetical protein